MLRQKGHIVGFMGDGINDAAALREADVGISVDTAVDIAKESADIILLEKSLLVLEAGISEGRKTFGNIVKYIKMGASSNFGNMFSVLGASALLPFLPMQPVQILLNNLLYDFSQTGIPFDHVDKEYLTKPRKWLVGDIQKFMLFIGPISSIFDYATYGLMWFVFSSQYSRSTSLVSNRLARGKFDDPNLDCAYHSHSQNPLFSKSSGFTHVFDYPHNYGRCLIYLPFSPIASALGFVPLPTNYFFWLALILSSYCVLTQLVKTWFVKQYGYN